MTATTSQSVSAHIPEGLKWTFLIHAIVAFIFGSTFYFVPELWGEWVDWGAVDPTMTRVYGGALLSVAVASWLGYQADRWSAVRLLVLFEIAFPAISLLAALYEVVLASAPVFSWVPVVAYAVFTIAFGYYYSRMS